MKRLFPKILILSILFILLIAFAACTPDEPTPIEEETFDLTKDILSSYSVIVPEGCSDELQSLANAFCDDIKAVTGTSPSLNDDFVNDTFKEGEYEILIGKVNRKEADEFYEKIRYYDLGYALVGKKVLIVGYSDKSLKSALYRFSEDVLKSTDNVLLRSNDSSILKGSYDYETVTLNGVEISNYKIVYPSKSTASESTFATLIKDWITEKTGYVLDTVVDNKNEKTDFEIQIGSTNRITDDILAEKNAVGGDDSYAVYGKDGFIWLSGKTTTILRCAIAEFCGLLTSEGTMEVKSVKAAKPSEINLSIMSYNIYFDLNDPNRDPSGVLTSIAERMPDVFNTVETTDDWFKLFDKKFGESYTVVKGKKFEKASDGLYNAIFFKTDMFELVESGTRWFSDTPTKMSKFDISPHYKGMTYALLRDKTSGAEFVYVSAHTSYGESRSEALYNDNAALCREKQIEVLKEQLAPFSMYPIIIGGDFNTKPTSKAILLLTSGTRYANTTSIADEVIYTSPASHPTLCRVKNIGEDGNTIPPYTELNPSANQIDYIFVTKDSITVQKFEEWDNKVNGKYPSDHIPVCAEITIFGN